MAGFAGKHGCTNPDTEIGRRPLIPSICSLSALGVGGHRHPGQSRNPGRTGGVWSGRKKTDIVSTPRSSDPSAARCSRPTRHTNHT
jgi:hypothetical protein